MKKLAITTIALASLVSTAYAAEPEFQGFEANSVNTWLANRGYRNTTTDADADQQRRNAILGAEKLDDQAAAAKVKEHLDRTRLLFPNFDSYPLYLQTTLLKCEANGEFAGGVEDPTVRTINTDNWPSAAQAYHDRAEFTEAESYFAAKDAYDATPDKNTPAARDLAATMSQYESRKNDRAALDRMQMNELAFLRYARETDIERTWKRAVILGNEGFAQSNPVNATTAYGMNRGLTVADYNDVANRQIRRNQTAGGSTGNATPPFAFTVPNSTGGFSDITVPHNHSFTFTLLDRHVVDGDVETVTFVNGKGTHINQTITLTSQGQVFTARAAKGPNELRILAQNQGSQGVNSGGIRISSPVIHGVVDQNVSLLTGQTGVLRVTGR